MRGAPRQVKQGRSNAQRIDWATENGAVPTLAVLTEDELLSGLTGHWHRGLQLPGWTHEAQNQCYYFNSFLRTFYGG